VKSVLEALMGHSSSRILWIIEDIYSVSSVFICVQDQYAREFMPGTNAPWYSQTFEYDQLNRLASAAGRYGTISYTYDDVGNRHTRDTNGTVETYTYFAGTNRLQAVTGGQNPRTFAYDSNGNITGDGTLTFTFDQNNQLIEVEQGANSIAEYAYNGLGQRVIKQAGANTTVYHYDLDGQLIAESLLDGTMTREYLYMGKVRIAMVDVAGGNALYHYLNDRLGTPEILTDATGTVAWEAWYEPFGEAHIHPSSSVVNNIRLPGQYFDAETGLHYNYHRYYDPRTGRYLTPDPIGLLGGINLFPYSQGNPVNSIDPLGLYRSPAYLLYTVPGQSLYDYGMTSIENRDYALAGLYFAGMVGEQILFALTLGESMAARGAVVCEVGTGEGTLAGRHIANATKLYRNGPLTNAGRALTKHPNVIGESGNILQKLGGAGNVNKAAARALNNIIRNGTMTTKVTKAFGEVIEYKLPNGIGARFSATTHEFITFLGRGL
jgi:RHS repeat-associated protein